MLGPTLNAPVLCLHGFGLAWGPRLVLEGLDLELSPRALLVLLGPGGAGKSSLLRALAGVNAGDQLRLSGTASYLGAPLGEGPRPALVAQSARAIATAAVEALAESLPDRSRLSRGEQREVIEAALGRAGLSSLSARLGSPMLELPRAAQRCLRIVAGALGDPRLLLIDEPTAGLDEPGRRQVLSVIERVREGRAVVLVSHDRRDALELGGETALLAGGRVQERAPSSVFFASPRTEAGKTYVATGGCPLPSPGASPDDLDPSYAAGARAAEPRGFRWVLPGQLGGLPRPGLLADVGDDLRGLAQAGVKTLVCLEEQRTVAEGELLAAGIEPLWLPIADMAAPEPEALASLCAQIEARLAAGSPVAVHCRGGVGRTGTVLAAYLVWLGKTPADALAQVRATEPRSVETEAQEALLHTFGTLAKPLRERRRS